MNSSHLCLEFMFLERRMATLSTLWSSSSPKSSGRSCYNLATFYINIASVGFTILPHILTFTSWLHLPWDRHPTAAELCYRSLIPWLHRVPSNLSRLFGWELHVQAAQTPILGTRIGWRNSIDLFVGTVARSPVVWLCLTGGESGRDLNWTENTSTGPWSQVYPVQWKHICTTETLANEKFCG